MFGEAFAFERVVVGTPVAVLTPATYFPADDIAATSAFANVISGSISYRIDGGTPQGTVGHPFAFGEIPRSFSVNEIRNFKAVRQGGSDAIIAITYRR